MNRFVLALIVLIPTLVGCLGSTYWGDFHSAQTIHLRLYSTVAPTISSYGNYDWRWTSDEPEPDDLFLRSKWAYEPGKNSIVYKAAIGVVDTRSTIKTIIELQKHIESGGMEGVKFAQVAAVKGSQANLLCVRPPLYSEIRPEDGLGHFVYLMACVDTRTQIYYELFVVQDVANNDKTTPVPSNGFKAGADRFFADFKVK